MTVHGLQGSSVTEYGLVIGRPKRCVLSVPARAARLLRSCIQVVVGGASTVSGSRRIIPNYYRKIKRIIGFPHKIQFFGFPELPVWVFSPLFLKKHWRIRESNLNKLIFYFNVCTQQLRLCRLSLESTLNSCKATMVIFKVWRNNTKILEGYDGAD